MDVVSSSFLSPNSKPPKEKLPHSIANFSKINESYPINDVTIADEKTEIDYLERKIALQELEMKRMKTTTATLEDASIKTLEQSDDPSLTPAQRKSIYVEQTVYLLEISMLEDKMDNQRLIIETLNKTKDTASLKITELRSKLRIFQDEVSKDQAMNKRFQSINKSNINNNSEMLKEHKK